MCGIAGAVWNDPRLAIDDATLRRMTNALRHRGPDGDGYFQQAYGPTTVHGDWPGVAFGHRRLAIIDPQSGQQPMTNEDGSVVVVFNGEIYNHEALRQRLEGNGHQFRSNCDTEVIVHLYEDWGVDFASHLNGMFALAIWDVAKRRLIVARDRMGQKPLFYRHVAGQLLFASELKSLLMVDGVTRDVDPAALDAFLTFQYVPHPLTIYRGIQKLPPSCLLELSNGQLQLTRYWTVADPEKSARFGQFGRERRRASTTIDPEAAERTERVWASELRQTLSDSVRLRMRSDVPLGAFLSGGVDSSVIVALMREHHAGDLKSFTMAFPDRTYDESGFARQVSRHLRTDHHEFVWSPQAIELLPELARVYDEPFADSSAIPTWFLAQQTRQHVTVALSGDGGDELFVGYDRYRAFAWANYADRLPRWMRAAIANVGWRRLPWGSRQKSRVRHLLRFLETLPLEPWRRYLTWISVFDETRRAAMYDDSFVAQLQGDADPLRFLLAACDGSSVSEPLAQVAWVDASTYLPGDLLTKVDMATMAHGLECRQPMLDPRVVALSQRIPLRLKYRRGRGKRIFQQAFGDLLPEQVWRRRKMGFAVPVDEWFRHELRDMFRDFVLSPDARCHQWLRPETIANLFHEHQTRINDHSARLWSLLILEQWLRGDPLSE